MADYYSFQLEQTEEGTYSYTFITVNSIFYYVHFDITEYESHLNKFPLLLEEGYAFSIFSHSADPDSKRKYDGKIRATISEIVNHFYKEVGKDTILLFHCDGSDSKQRHRHITFNQWYNEFNTKGEFIKEAIQFEINSEVPTRQYLGYIASIQNKNLSQLRDEFETFSYTITTEKGVV